MGQARRLGIYIGMGPLAARPRVLASFHPFRALRRHRCSPVGLYLGGGLPGPAVNRIINSRGNSRNRILAFKFSRSRGPRRKRLAVGLRLGAYRYAAT